MSDGSVDLKNYWRLFVKWWWLFALSAAIAAVVAYLVTASAPPVYRATAQVSVERHRVPGVLSSSDLEDSAMLAQSYTDLIKMRPTLELIAQRLPQQESPEAVEKKLTITTRSNIIEITAEDSHPLLAATLANTTANTFIEQVLDRQISHLERVEDILRSRNIQQPEDIVSAQAAMVGMLSIVEPAIPPSGPANANIQRNVLVAAAVGLLLAGLAVLLIEYLDDAVRSPEELMALTGLSSLGSIPRYRNSNSLVINSPPNDRRRNFVLESYKFLETHLDFAARDNRHVKVLMIASPGMKEGKTTTATNLAVSLSREGRSVILVDSDLRMPSLHDIFDLGRDTKGFTDAIAGAATVNEALYPTSIEGLRVMPGGEQRVDPASALRSPRVKDVVEELRDSADFVLFDSAPLFAVTDSLLLASHVDGVLLVAYTGRTSRDAAVKASEVLNQVSPPLAMAGSVLVNYRGKEWKHYYGYYGEMQKSDRGPALQRLVHPVTIVFSLVVLLIGAVSVLAVGFPNTWDWIRQLVT